MSNPVMVLSTDNLGTGKNYISQDAWTGDALSKVNSDQKNFLSEPKLEISNGKLFWKIARN